MRINDTNYKSIANQYEKMVQERITIASYCEFEIQTESYSIFADIENRPITNESLLRICENTIEGDWKLLNEDDIELKAVCGDYESGRISVYPTDDDDSISVNCQRSHKNLFPGHLAKLVSKDCETVVRILESFKN